MACCSIKTFFTSHEIFSTSRHWSTAKSRRAGNNSVAISGALFIDGNPSTTSTTLVEVPIETSPFVLSRSLTKRPLVIETPQERVVNIGNGKFGRFGGKFVPETLVTCLNDLETEFRSVLHDPQFQVLLFMYKLYIPVMHI